MVWMVCDQNMKNTMEFAVSFNHTQYLCCSWFKVYSLCRLILGAWSAQVASALLGGVMSSWEQYRQLLPARGLSLTRPLLGQRRSESHDMQVVNLGHLTSCDLNYVA